MLPNNFSHSKQMRCTLSPRPPISIWVDIASKRGKNTKKWQTFFEKLKSAIQSLHRRWFQRVSSRSKRKSVRRRWKWSRRKKSVCKIENGKSHKDLECRKRLLARTCSARLPTAMLFFCCHKCHTGNEKEGEKERKIREKRRDEKSVFHYFSIEKWRVKSSNC